MPRCVRCQSLLALAEVAVVPPRASRLRWGTRLRHMWYRIGSMARSVWEALPRLRSSSQLHVQWEALAWSIVPGLGHIKYGDKLTGKLLLSGWIALLLLALVTLASGWDRWFVAGAVALHGVAMLTLLGPVLAMWSAVGRALVGLMLFVGLGLLIYRPIGWLGSRFYLPFHIAGIQPGSMISDGDGVLCEGPWLRPAQLDRGDLVLYRIAADGSAHGGHGYTVAAGFGLDRIVGLPGDHVHLVSGRLLVNGEPAEEGATPLGNLSWLAEMEVHVRDGAYAIIPSQLAFAVHGYPDPGRILAQLSRVRDQDVFGRVVLRVHPWSRFSVIE